MHPDKIYLDDFLEAPLISQEISYIRDNQKALLLEGSFAGYPSFGTGGMREITGLGTNRMNIYNVARLTQALTTTLRQQTKINKQNNLIVIGYDSRLSSIPFAATVQYILKENNFQTFVFSRPIPTPMVSFGIVYMKAVSGVVITASHNPPEYNGYKIYTHQGGQMLPHADKKIQSNFSRLSYADIGNDIHQHKEIHVSKISLEQEEDIIANYLKKLKEEDFVLKTKKTSKKISILYSPLHGTGGQIFERVFNELGYVNFSILTEQKEPDGHFPTIKSPNPEDKEAFELLIEKASRYNQPRLLLATDPDADRIGCYTWFQGKYHMLTGNQIGALLLDYKLKCMQKKMKAPFFCKSIVTSNLQRKIALSYNIEVRECLTGFKYIGSQLIADKDNYVFGSEESLGYLPINWVRDKDSISSAVMLANLANQIDLMERLNFLYIQHGLYLEQLWAINIQQNEQIRKTVTTLMEKSQSFLNQQIGKRKIIDVLLLKDKQKNPVYPITREAKKIFEQLSATNVIQFYLEPEGKLTIRPSGTEPKIKVYISLMYPKLPSAKDIEPYKTQLTQEIKELKNIVCSKLLEIK